MGLSIKNPETELLARSLAEETGETITGAICVALEERLARVRAGRGPPRALADELDEIAKRCASLPVVAEDGDDEVLGYDRRGIPA